ncbi:type II secretion system F family protein, partial [Demequina lutea]|nr:Flp pilus assembly protein TadB [Demequina lutea]
MSAVLGLTLGVGLLLVWMSFWPGQDGGGRSKSGWYERTQDQLIRAGAPGVTPWALVGTSIAVGLLVALFATGTSGSPVIGLAFAAISARGPFALVAARATKRQASMRDIWPEAVDHLASGIRAGLSLPEALSQLGERGPEQLREPFTAFAEDFRASGRFGD